jgi:predicted PurR-regulated permease PerM
MAEPQHDLTRTTLAVLFIGGLIATSFLILRPFLPAVIWATTVVVATWPLMLRVQERLWNRRGLAVTVMTLSLLLVFVVPFWLAIGTITENVSRIVGWATSLESFTVPPPPPWLVHLPFVGAKVGKLWETAATTRIHELTAQAAPYAGNVMSWFVSAVGDFGIVVVQFLLTVVVAAIMYAAGERAAGAVRRFGRRLAGERGEQAVRLAGQAIRGVALGVVVTALAQSVLGGVGLAIAGVPFAAVLTAVMFMVCIAQLGPGLVLVPAVIWLYWSGDPVWGTVLLVWTLVIGGLNNVMRPLLIKRGAHLPLLLILAGVIGGLIAFGLVGIFLGPVVLAVADTLLQAWTAEGESSKDKAALENKISMSLHK